MADKDSAVILQRLNDLSDRLVSNKRFDDLVESFQNVVAGNKKLVAEQEALRAEFAKTTKLLTDRILELEEGIRKDFKKLREEAAEAAAEYEPEDDSEPPKWIRPYIPKIQEGMGFVFDKDFGAVVKKKILKWVTKSDEGDAE